MSISGINPEPTEQEQAINAVVPAAGESVLETETPQIQKSEYDIITEGLLGKIGNPGASTNFKILLYGDPGTTKSSWLGTAPGNLIMDLEQGTISIKAAVEITGRPTAPGVKIIPLKSWEGVEAVIDRMANKVPEFDQWPVLSIDTMSDLHKKGLSGITERNWSRRPSINRYVPETDDHQENNERVVRLVRSLRDLDRDIILTAHARTVEPKGKPAKVYPDFSESLANKIEAMMDVVAYVYMSEVDTDEGKVQRPVFRMQNNGTIHAKGRIGLPEEVLDPTWEQLKDIWVKTVEAE